MIYFCKWNEGIYWMQALSLCYIIILVLLFTTLCVVGNREINVSTNGGHLLLFFTSEVKDQRCIIAFIDICYDWIASTNPVAFIHLYSSLLYVCIDCFLCSCDDVVFVMFLFLVIDVCCCCFCRLSLSLLLLLLLRLSLVVFRALDCSRIFENNLIFAYTWKKWTAVVQGRTVPHNKQQQKTNYLLST